MLKSVSRFFVEFPLLMFLLETFSFIVGWHVTIWPFILSYLALMGYEVVHISSIKDRLTYAICCIFLTFACLLIMAFLYDTSYDGPWYHAAVIKEMTEGWNPFFQPILSIDETPYHIDCHIWMSHYAKGMETIQAGIVALTGNLESGKALNLFWLIALCGYIFTFLKQFLSGYKKWELVVLTSIVALNPVILGQLLTYMIDWTGYSLVIIGAICIYDYLVNEGKRNVITLTLLAFFLPTVKFNIVFWWVILLMGVVATIWWTYKKFSKQLIVVVALSMTLGFVIGGFNPYITNMVHKGNPVYPLIGKDKIDIMDIVTPKAILGKNRFYQVNYSLMSNPYHNDKKGEEGFHCLSISKYNVMSSPLHDPQLGGFGLFFFEACVVLLILFMAVKKKDGKWKMMGLILIGLYLSLLILPSGFLARYVPYFYVFPCLLLLFILKTHPKGWVKQLCLLPVCFLMLDVFINIAGVVMLETQLQNQVSFVVKEVTKASSSKKVYVNTASCLHYDKMERAGAVLKYGGDKENIKSQIDMLGVDIWTSLTPEDFSKENYSWLMKKIPMFVPKLEEVK